MFSPADTLAASAVFRMVRSGHWTVTFACAVTIAWFVALALATLWYSLHESKLVLDETFTLALAPLARSPRLHASVSAAPSHAALSSLHETPVPVGSGSLTVTPFATPGPA